MPRILVKDASVSVFDDAKTRADGGGPTPQAGCLGGIKEKSASTGVCFPCSRVSTMCGALLHHIFPTAPD